MPTKAPTAAQKRRFDDMVSLGCIVGPSTYCEGRITIHHCFTGAGGRKDHSKTIPICWGHHLGAEGIDGKRMSKRAWQEKYGTEAELLEKTEVKLLEKHGFANPYVAAICLAVSAINSIFKKDDNNV